MNTICSHYVHQVKICIHTDTMYAVVIYSHKKTLNFYISKRKLKHCLTVYLKNVMYAFLKLWGLVGFEDFCTKTTGSHGTLHRNFSGPVSSTDLVKSSKDLVNLVVCNEKKIFGWGLWIFCE